MSEIIAGKPVESFNEEDIATTVNQLMDTVPIANYTTVKWIISVEDLTNNKFHTCEIIASHKQSANPVYVRENIIGDSIPYTLDIQLDVGNIKLYYQNDEANTVKVKAARISL